MSTIKLKRIKQAVDTGVTQPLSIGGIASDNSDEVMNITSNGKLTIPQEAWIYPTLQNGWVNYLTTYPATRFMKDSMGFVHLDGMVKQGTITAGTVVFTLPVGYRPSHDIVCSAITATLVFCCIEIKANGSVVVLGGNATYQAFNGITFKAEA